ncbi:MAG: C4-dicarboxylate ABC transporter [Rhodospirillales bacterium]
MRSGIVGAVVGGVLGIVIGASVIGPRLHPRGGQAGRPTPTVPAAPADVARDLPRLLLPRPDVEIKIAGAASGDLPLAGTLGRRFDILVTDASRGQVEINLYEPDVLVPSGDLLEAVAAGAVDGAFAPPSMIGDGIPALELFGGIPFGPDISEFLGWVKFGGGREILGEIGEARGVHLLICGLLPPAAAGWFRKEIEIVADLKGVKMAVDGLGARALDRLGVQTRRVNLPQVGAELDAGIIDAISFSAPAVDFHIGLQKHLKYYYFPGWQSPSALLLLVNRGKWQALKSSQRVLMETACGDNVSFSVAEGGAAEYAALQDLRAAGVQFRRWPSTIRDELARSWLQIVEEQSSRDAEFRRVWASLSTFRKQYGVWSELSAR